MTPFDALLLVASIVAGGIASIAGFGIGSVLTPLVATQSGMGLAVAAVSIPHLVATAYRCWLLRTEIDWQLLKGFGLMSAIGGLAGAAVQLVLGSPWLGIVLGGLLLFVSITGFLGLGTKIVFMGALAWVAGLVSGFLGGLVGNQGGIRSGAMIGMGVSKAALVATGTATGVIVDGARMPVYVWRAGSELLDMGKPICIMIVGVLIGTLYGKRVLDHMPEPIFRRVLYVLLLALGIWLCADSARQLSLISR